MKHGKRFFIPSTLALYGISIFFSATILAQTSNDTDIANDRDELIEFYHATNGESWENNDGWLGEPGTECDWHGIDCGDDNGEQGYFVALMNNGLSGSIPDSLGQAAGIRGLVLFGNDISGTWVLESDSYEHMTYADLNGSSLSGIEVQENAAPRLTYLVAKNNRLDTIPTGLSNLARLGTLDLSFNEMSGPLPESLADLELKGLKLVGNELTGSIVPALEAMSHALSDPDEPSANQGVFLDLRDNRFSGAIDDAVLAQERSVDGWVDLCWNSLEASGADAMAWLESEHADKPFEICLDRTLRDLDPSVSGSWYNPERSGEGYSVMLLEDGQTMIYWFTYSPADASPQRQNWLVDSKVLEHPGLEPLRVGAPMGGRFGYGLENPQEYPLDMIGDVNLAWLEGGGLLSQRSITTAQGADPVVQNIEMTQLSMLAGSTCENQNEFQGYSGAWYSPGRSGEGFVVEVLPNEEVLVYWFTFEPGQSGYQSWMIGDGEFLSDGPGTDTISTYQNRAEIELLQPVGGAFGPEFDSAEIEVRDWGSLELRFSGPNSGHVIWDSQIDGFGDGNYPMERLARPKLADCD